MTSTFACGTAAFTPKVKIAPTAKDLSKGLYQYHLDFPGNPLDPGCDYLHWQSRLIAGRAPTVYAHVATDPAHAGKLAPEMLRWR